MKNVLVVFAGGSGRRMLPLTSETNKVLLKYRGSTILMWCLKPFFELGFKNITLLTSHYAENVEAYAKENFPDNTQLNFIKGELSINSRIRKILPIPEEGLITLHGNIVLKQRTVTSFIKKIETFNGDFLLLTSKRKENFFSGHPYCFEKNGIKKCQLGFPNEKQENLRCCIGLNYMSKNTLKLIQELPDCFVPENLLVQELIDFEELNTNALVKHFEKPKDLI